MGLPEIFLDFLFVTVSSFLNGFTIPLDMRRHRFSVLPRFHPRTKPEKMPFRERGMDLADT